MLIMKTNDVIIRPLRRMTIQERIDDGMYNATDFLNQWYTIYPNKAITFEEFIEKEEHVFENLFGENLHLNERYVKEEDGIWMEPCLFNSLLITIDEDLWVELEMEKAEDKGRRLLTLLIGKSESYNNEYKYTYVLTDKSGKYKIGRTSDIKKRVSTLSVGNPTIRIVAIIIGNVEEELHRKFRSKLVKGEWYELSPTDIKYILSKYTTINS